MSAFCVSYELNMIGMAVVVLRWRQQAARRHARRRDEQYEAKTATLAGRRYIVCRNHLEAEKDAATGIAQSGASALSYAKLALS